MPRGPCLLQFQGPDARPLAGVPFVVERAAEPVPEIAYVTGRGGEAQVGLPPGEVSLRVFLPDGTSQLSQLRIGDGPGSTYVVRLLAGQQP